MAAHPAPSSTQTRHHHPHIVPAVVDKLDNGGLGPRQPRPGRHHLLLHTELLRGVVRHGQAVDVAAGHGEGDDRAHHHLPKAAELPRVLQPALGRNWLGGDGHAHQDGVLHLACHAEDDRQVGGMHGHLLPQLRRVDHQLREQQAVARRLVEEAARGAAYGDPAGQRSLPDGPSIVGRDLGGWHPSQIPGDVDGDSRAADACGNRSLAQEEGEPLVQAEDAGAQAGGQLLDLAAP
eukprot:scaffold13341_cov101-Isochrysis_galbana.AAC.1